ncbi:hypothetical protein ACK3TF_003820 [Chlorella vulgaris]
MCCLQRSHNAVVRASANPEYGHQFLKACEEIVKPLLGVSATLPIMAVSLSVKLQEMAVAAAKQVGKQQAGSVQAVIELLTLACAHVGGAEGTGAVADLQQEVTSAILFRSNYSAEAIYGGKDTDLSKYLSIDVPILLAALPACKAAVNEARSPRWRFLPPADLPISSLEGDLAHTYVQAVKDGIAACRYLCGVAMQCKMAALKLDLDAEALQAACDAGDALRQFMEHLDPTQADSTFDALDEMQEVLAAEAAAERRAREELGQWTGVLQERFAELQQQHQRSVTGVDHKFTEILQRVDSLRGAGSDRVAALSAKVTDLAAAMAQLQLERTRLKLTKCSGALGLLDVDVSPSELEGYVQTVSHEMMEQL